MGKIQILVLLVVLAHPSISQEWLKGELIDAETSEAIPFAHIKNVSTQKQTIANREGLFRIPVAVNDSIVLSIVGYKLQSIVILSHHLESITQFTLYPDTVLLEAVIVNRIPEEEVFKQRVLSMTVKDSSFAIYGIPPPVFGEDKTLNEKYVKNPLFLLAHPITGWHYRYSKKEKERRKMHRIKGQTLSRARVERKFTRDWVGEVTSLEADELTDFIAYCDYESNYIDKTPLYIIQEDIMKKLQLFKSDSTIIIKG